MTPFVPNNLYLLTRPVSYMSASYDKKLESVKSFTVIIMFCDNLCLDKSGQKSTVTEEHRFNDVTFVNLKAIMTPDRVAMTDRYDTVSDTHIGFVRRTV